MTAPGDLFDALVRVFGPAHAVTAAQLLPGVTEQLALDPTLQPSEAAIAELLERSITMFGLEATHRLVARFDWRAARALDRLLALSPRHGPALPWPRHRLPPSLPSAPGEAVSVPLTVSSIEDAITLAESTLGRDSLAALVLGSRMTMPVSGDPPADAVLSFHRVLLEALHDEDDTIVLATRRRTGPPFVLEEELARWREMQSRHVAAQLVLADWFVFVRDECVLSLAEIAGPPAVWS